MAARSVSLHQAVLAEALGAEYEQGWSHRAAYLIGTRLARQNVVAPPGTTTDEFEKPSEAVNCRSGVALGREAEFYQDLVEEQLGRALGTNEPDKINKCTAMAQVRATQAVAAALDRLATAVEQLQQ